MKSSINWIKDFADINCSIDEFAHKMTMSGTKVETVEEMNEEITNVRIGRILKIEPHPDADKLVVTQIDMGNEQLQIVTGATNCFEGALVPVACVGATLPGDIKIKKGKLRGIESSGMMCSIAELGLTLEDAPGAIEDGIYILPEVTEDGVALKPGMDAKEALGLNQVVIDFEITPNRPDCQGVYGVAREAAVTLGTDFKPLEITLKEESDKKIEDIISVDLQNAEKCPRYMCKAVTDVKIGPSPKWLRDKLKSAGIRSINNIVDITNYIMVELAQPMHAFDMRDLNGNKIIIRDAKEGEIMTTLDDVERKLDSSMLVIADAERAVAVAGVMGGQNSEVKEDTTTVLFESANFLGKSVRATSRKLGLRTDASSKYEKGLDPETAKLAVYRACQLVEELGCGKVVKGEIDCYPNPYVPYEVEFDPEYINKRLGTNIDRATMEDYLVRLGFEFNSEGSAVKVPSYRTDVKLKADLMEEVARLYDYNNIEPTLLDNATTTLGKKTDKQKIEDIISDTLIGLGYSEIYTYSFGSTKTFDMLNIPEDSELRNPVIISNPLGEDFKAMRTTTIGDMLTVLARNASRRTDEASLFELSKVYINSEDTELPIEKEVLTLGKYGKCDFFDLKGAVEVLLSKLGIEASYAPMSDNPTFHSGRAARIFVNDVEIGYIGEIRADVVKNYGAPKRSYIAVLTLAELVSNATKITKYKQLPKYPAMMRDLAIVIDDEILVGEMERIIKQRGGKILESVTLFDVFKGGSIEAGKKSVAFSLVFRAPDRTLTDEDVAKSMKKIIDGLAFEFGAEQRA